MLMALMFGLQKADACIEVRMVANNGDIGQRPPYETGGL